MHGTQKIVNFTLFKEDPRQEDIIAVPITLQTFWV